MIFENRISLGELSQLVQCIRQEIGRIIVGQEEMINLLLVALLADGHVLIEGVPGVAKTLTAKLLAQLVAVKFARIQFTPDLMPSDVLGTVIFNQKTADFEFKKGAIFTNLVLIDEINRAPAKTQSALFEVMEERQISIDGTTYPMVPPFMVLATQNPIEQEGTYPLPEAQLDRFLFKIEVHYPTLSQETQILEKAQQRQGDITRVDLQPVLTAEKLLQFRQKVQEIHVENPLLHYIAQIVHHTRQHPALFLGASPRASLAILRASKAWAAMQGRDFVSPDDIKFVCLPVLAHRVALTPEKEMEGISTRTVLQQVIQKVEVPR
ncbi:MAG: MoxR family ATPase [Microscillaceae bacterium]|nr:MoxR family ATPase [Microscillaceae bacterium]MDW8461286.1 MoxR family ATPase [Cytophagales bacterium]